MCAVVQLWRSVNNLRASVFSFYLSMGSRDRTVARIFCKCLYLLSNLVTL